MTNDISTRPSAAALPDIDGMDVSHFPPARLICTALERGLRDLVSILVKLETAFDPEGTVVKCAPDAWVSAQNADLARQVAEDLHTLARIHLLIGEDPAAVTPSQAQRMLRLERTRQYLTSANGTKDQPPEMSAGGAEWL